MKRLKTVGISIIALYLVILFMLLNFQEKLIFRSQTLPQNHVFTSVVPFGELFLKASDGAVLNGLHYKQEQPKGVLIYFHGNAQTLEYWGKWAEELSKRYQYDVVLMDYRGFGKSTGKRSFDAMLADGMLFYDYCKTKFPEEQITIFGRSLGGAFATHVATKTNSKRLVLESTFTSVYEIASKRFWFLPLNWLLKYPFQNDQNIQQISIPTYFIHGTEDAVVPYEHGKTLYEKSGSGTKKLYTIQNGMHNDLVNYPAYFEALDEILK
ncbi:alpha/beta hydrolase [Kordia sp.]|uniref:alpha/beta hydrolase n=1 Tax=Kordia sp. TaxID=1965332 RepID=UPI003D271BD7